MEGEVPFHRPQSRKVVGVGLDLLVALAGRGFRPAGLEAGQVGGSQLVVEAP